MVKQKECDTTLTICLKNVSNKAVKIYQAFIIDRESKADFSKSQTINRIIEEWAEDRSLTLEVAKKKKGLM